MAGGQRLELKFRLSRSIPNMRDAETIGDLIQNDLSGLNVEGSGISPQVPLEVFSKEDVSAGHLKAARAVVDMPRGKKPNSI